MRGAVMRGAVICNAELEGKIVELRIHDGIVTNIVETHQPGQASGQASGQVEHGEARINARGGAILPGLHDHHIHLNACAAALDSLVCGPPDVHDIDGLIAVLHGTSRGTSRGTARDSADAWLRGIGYHRSVAGDIDRFWLDAHGPQRPIRIQHRGGRLWILNSRAIDLLDRALLDESLPPLDIPKNGRLIDKDEALRTALSGARPNLANIIAKLFSYGITGVTETTPGNNREDLRHYVGQARSLWQAEPLRLSVMGGLDLSSPSPYDLGLHDPGPYDSGPYDPGLHDPGTSAHVGPLKIHYHDHDLPALADLTRQIQNAHALDRAVALHCVTRAELMLGLAAIEDADPHYGDRIEHAAVADDEALAWIKKLDLTIVTQPHFITERATAYLKEVETNEYSNLWRLHSFLDAGIRLAAGSDAPFGGLNPWKAMASAVKRPKKLGPNEAISPEEALQLYTKPLADAGGKTRRITPGCPADLCLLDRPWSAARQNLANIKVRATWVGGKIVYDKISSTKPHASAV